MQNKKIAELDGGLEVWQLVIAGLKEQDINAQVMEERKMKILTSNIKNRGALESLPYVLKEGEKFTIISGHHRVRAANNAGMKTCYCLVETNSLTKSQVISKQIAHNELVGAPDSEILGQLVKQMQDVDDLIASGLPEKYLNSIDADSVTIDLPQLNFDWRTVTLTFLPDQVKDFEMLVKMIDSHSEMIGVANVKQYDEFVRVAHEFGKTQNIKSMSATISYLTDLALKEIAKWQENQNTTESTT